MLGNAINNLTKKESVREKAVISSKSKGEQEVIAEKVAQISTIIEAIKENIYLIEQGKISPKILNNKIVKVGDNKTIFNKCCYDSHIHSRNKMIDFFAFYNSVYGLGIQEMLLDFKAWLTDNGFSTAHIRYEYDTGGVSSWNSYWIEPLKN